MSSVREYLLERLATPKGKLSEDAKQEEQLATPQGKSSVIAMRLDSTPTPPSKREAPDQGGPRYRLRKLQWFPSAASDDGVTCSPATLARDAPLFAGNTEDPTFGEMGSPSLALVTLPCEPIADSDAEDLPSLVLVTPLLTPAPVTPPRVLPLCNGPMGWEAPSPGDDQMMVELFGETVVLESPLRVTLCPEEAEHPRCEHNASTLGKMLEQVPVSCPSWLGLRISGELGARVSLQEGLAVGRACFGGLQASAVTLRLERRFHKHDGHCFVTFACKFGGKQVGSSIVHEDGEGGFILENLVSPALVWRCVALASRPPADESACAELCAIAKASFLRN